MLKASNMESAAKKLIESIVGEKLSAIVFVLDYWQLQFDGPSINALTRLEVSANNLILLDGADQFRNLICGQIAKIVASIALKETEAFIITFEDQRARAERFRLLPRKGLLCADRRERAPVQP
jgi:hypothetical protein